MSNYSTPIDYIKSKLDERRTEIEQHIGSGAAKDFTEYQKLCGFIQGLEFANQITIDLARRMENDDDSP